MPNITSCLCLSLFPVCLQEENVRFSIDYLLAHGEPNGSFSAAAEPPGVDLTRVKRHLSVRLMLLCRDVEQCVSNVCVSVVFIVIIGIDLFCPFF